MEVKGESGNSGDRLTVGTVVLFCLSLQVSGKEKARAQARKANVAFANGRHDQGKFDKMNAVQEGQANSVYSPSYYADHRVSPLDLIESYGLDFCSANVVKYVARADEKGGDDDRYKALWYLLRKLGFTRSECTEAVNEVKERRSKWSHKDVLSE